MFLFLFIIIHAIGNLHVFLGPDDFNGYGYFYVRLYWSGFGLEANIVEEYVALCALLHVVVALKRTYEISLKMASETPAVVKESTLYLLNKTASKGECNSPIA